MAVNVAFCRSLKVGKRGRDVVAHKRALSHAAPDLYPWMDFTGYFGTRFSEAIGKWQKRKGMVVTGRVGEITHEALERAKDRNGDPAFDAYAIKLAKDFCEEFTHSPREDMLDAGFYWYANRYQILYSQARPMLLGYPPWVPRRWDCSGFVTACYYAANAPDPNGRNYDGLGYTGTLVEHGTKISQSQAKPGDLVFYGFVTNPKPGFPYGAPTHVAINVGNGMVLSMGSYPMSHYTISYREIHSIRTYKVE